MTMEKVQSLGELKRITIALPNVREEMRRNLIRCIAEKRPLFPDMKGYDDTVMPQLVNAILCGHNIIILGERGQGKSRLIRNLMQSKTGGIRG
jgi:magnesium chelatase subunit I